MGDHNILYEMVNGFADLLPLFIDKPMMYPRGAKFQYNNSGYVILALVLEKITGMYFDEYLKKNIFDIFDMESTGYYELDRLPARCANSYIYCDDTDDYRTNIYSADAKGTGAGGAFITVKDVVNFWYGLLDGKLLSERMVSGLIPYFQGCDPGVSFISEYNPQNGIISVLVSNYGDNVWKEMRKIRKLLYGKNRAAGE